MMSGYDFLKSQVLRRWQNADSDWDVVMSSGRVFQTRGPATYLCFKHNSVWSICSLYASFSLTCKPALNWHSRTDGVSVGIGRRRRVAPVSATNEWLSASWRSLAGRAGPAGLITDWQLSHVSLLQTPVTRPSATSLKRASDDRSRLANF